MKEGGGGEGGKGGRVEEEVTLFLVTSSQTLTTHFESGCELC